MNFKNFDIKVKILFLLTNIFLLITLGMFITFLLTSIGSITHFIFLITTIWFGSTSVLIFHYLLWKNLDFMQQIDWDQTHNLTFITAVVSYVILFPIIFVLTIAFLFIFSTIILVMVIKNIGKNKEPEVVKTVY